MVLISLLSSLKSNVVRCSGNRAGPPLTVGLKIIQSSFRCPVVWGEVQATWLPVPLPHNYSFTELLELNLFDGVRFRP